MTTASDNVFPKVILDGVTSDPAAPSNDNWKLYAKPDGVYARSSNAIVGPFGGAGGAVATDAIWDAKGDLAVGTGANTAQRLAVGSNNYVLTADSGATTGVKWAAASATGAPELPIDAAATASVGSGDLFGGTSLDGGWSNLQTTSVTTKDRTYDGFLILKNSGNTSGQDRGVQRAFSPAGDFTVYTKILHQTARATYQWAGVFAGASTPGDGGGGNRIELHAYTTTGNSGWSLKFVKLAAGVETVVFDTDLRSIAGVGLWNAQQFPVWYRVKRTGSTLYAGVSWDGVEFIDHATTTTIGFTVATCGLYIAESTATDDMRATFGYIATTG